MLDDPLGAKANMVLRGPWRPEFAKLIKEHGIRKLTLSISMSWWEDSIDFISELPPLDAIIISTNDRLDLAPLFSQSCLKELILPDCFKGKFDPSKFQHLEHLATRWSTGLQNLPACMGLKRLTISAYPYEDFAPIETLSRVEQLTVFSKKLISLKGLSAFQNLKTLNLFYCSNLVDVGPLNDCQILREIDLSWSKRLIKLPDALAISGLKKFSMNVSGGLESLIAIKNCLGLEEVSFYGSTSIKDGQIAFLADLPFLREARFKNRTHYDVTLEALAASLIRKSA